MMITVTLESELWLQNILYNLFIRSVFLCLMWTATGVGEEGRNHTIDITGSSGLCFHINALLHSTTTECAVFQFN